MFENSVITNDGASILAQWAGGGTLHIDRAAAGSGTVPALELMRSTALADERQTLSIIAQVTGEKQTQFHLQFAPASASYTANQIGLWAHVDEQESKLFAIYQDDTGISIPSGSEMPEFVYAFYAVIAVDNDRIVDVNVDPNAYVTLKTILEYETKLEGLVTGAEARMEELLDKAGLKDVYTPDNPPPYPVTSVNGATGAVNITDIAGNAATATKLASARTINGTPFDGTEDIDIPISLDRELTIPTDGWSPDESGMQTVSVPCEGIREADRPIVDVLLTGHPETDEAILEGWMLVSMIRTTEGSVTVFASEVPSVQIPIQMKVVY